MSSISVSTALDADVEQVWAAVQTPTAFRFVTRGLIAFPAFDRAGPRATAGLEVEGTLLLLAVLPIGRYRIRVVTLDHQQRELVTQEGGGLVHSWRHRITVTPLGDGRCRYLDEVDIEAGRLTPAVVAFAHVFYRARQRRWRRLARLLAAGRPVD